LIQGMFLFDRLFDFNCPTYDISFVAKPSYNPQRPFDPCFLCLLK
jgi:hypothetical protein